jgi:hypothetical protein
LSKPEYQETIFELLSKQYEIAKIDEGKNAVVVQRNGHVVTGF